VGSSLAASATCRVNPAGGYYTLTSPTSVAMTSYTNDGTCTVTTGNGPLALAPGVCVSPGGSSLKLTSSADGLTVYYSRYLNTNCAGNAYQIQYGATNACLGEQYSFRATAGLVQPAFVAPSSAVNNIDKQ
jgi:hypothetical protein